MSKNSEEASSQVGSRQPEIRKTAPEPEPWGSQEVGKQGTRQRREILEPGEHPRQADRPLEFKELTGQIIGAAIRVHRELGPGFVESVYANALEIELRCARIPFERERLIRVVFREQEVGHHRPDFVVAGRIITELKAVKAIDDSHLVVVRSYLRAAALGHGLLLNFAKPTLEIRRVAGH